MARVRVFSIASPPGAGTVSIVYSVKGAYTRKMEDRLKTGTSIWLKLPYGEFVIKANIRAGQDVVLIAGGTGISPFIPYLEELVLGAAISGKIVLYYGARLRSYILFPELLARCADAIEGFRASISIENETSAGLHIPGAYTRDGRLSIDAIYAETKGLKDPVFFLSGPPAMIRLFRQQLADKGVVGDNIKIDEWE